MFLGDLVWLLQVAVVVFGILGEPKMKLSQKKMLRPRQKQGPEELKMKDQLPQHGYGSKRKTSRTTGFSLFSL